MTTYRSETDFEERFGRELEDRTADRRSSAISTTRARKLVERFDPDTYRVLVGAMDRHDVGRARGGIEDRAARPGRAATRLTGLGIAGDILYGPAQVRALVAAAERAGLTASYREVSSTKGHDAFLVEWPQLTEILRAALEEALIGEPAGQATG